MIGDVAFIIIAPWMMLSFIAGWKLRQITERVAKKCISTGTNNHKTTTP